MAEHMAETELECTYFIYKRDQHIEAKEYNIVKLHHCIDRRYNSVTLLKHAIYPFGFSTQYINHEDLPELGLTEAELVHLGQQSNPSAPLPTLHQMSLGTTPLLPGETVPGQSQSRHHLCPEETIRARGGKGGQNGRECRIGQLLLSALKVCRTTGCGLF